MFKITMLPGREGDCLLIEYGNANRPRRVLIDGGRTATYRDNLKQWFAALSYGQHELELLIVTHVDRDHIEGVLALFEDENPPVKFRDIWFNGFHHLHNSDFERFGPVQGERLSKYLAQPDVPWNEAYGGKSVVVEDDGPLPRKVLHGQLTLTLLSPSWDKLRELRPVWEKECRNAGIVTGVEERPPPPLGFERFGAVDVEGLSAMPFDEDDAEANGSSIAVLAEYEDRRVLLSGDAHPSLLITSMRKLYPNGVPMLSAFKVPHHGSKGNLSKDALLAMPAERYLLSTNGSYFNHPDPIAMSRLLKFGTAGKEIHFNYRSKETTLWGNSRWRRTYDYSVHYPHADGYAEVSLD